MVIKPGRSSVWLERTVRDREVAGSNPVAPTFFRKKPFGKNVEGLFPSNLADFSHVQPSSIHFDLEPGIFRHSP